VSDREYRNPVLDGDWSDPDVIRVGDDFYLVASSFHRVPGLPVLRSTDLIGWTIVGHALDRLEPATEFAEPQHGCGVWAPAIRHHAGRFWIFFPDPDRGLFVTTAPSAAGPWSRPHPVKTGRGLIDPCPLWDADGSAYLVHAWARSRAGFNNRITCHRMSPDASRLLDEGRTVIDGDQIPGYRGLEGPKAYRRGDWYWIFAPAGGVATGWQAVFRSRHIFGPYEHRTVLVQGDTDVNGPHQGAWVDTATGQDWFLHFQDRGAAGRVVHLQPMRWAEDGWPRIGRYAGDGPGTPVRRHTRPDLPNGGPTAPAASDDFPAGEPGQQWTWPANPRPDWYGPGRPRGLRLTCVRSADVTDLRRLSNVLGQRLPAAPATVTAELTLDSDVPGGRAGLTILGRSYAWIGLERTATGAALVCRVADGPPADGVGTPMPDGHTRGAERDLAPPVPLPVPLPAEGATATLRVNISPDNVCRFAAELPGARRVTVDTPYVAQPGHWVGATLGVFAAAPPSGADPAGAAGAGAAGYADIARVTVAGG